MRPTRSRVEKMKGIYLIALITALMLSATSCGSHGSNKDADLAFQAASAEMSQTNVSRYADKAYTELSDLTTEDACKLTLAYYYLYRNHYTEEYGERFGKCYEYSINKGESEANEYFNSLTDVDDAATTIRKGYDNIELMKEASESFKNMFGN